MSKCINHTDRPSYVYDSMCVSIWCKECYDYLNRKYEERFHKFQEHRKTTMQTLTKSSIVQFITNAIDRQESFNLEAILKNHGVVIKVDVSFKEQEVMIDANGVKWVRA